MSAARKLFSFRSLDRSIFLAALGTVAFYTVVSLPAMQGSLLAHYTTEHAVEYVIVALFIWGLADVVLKMLALPREMLATRQELLPAQTGRVPTTQATTLLDGVQSLPQWLVQSRIGRRVVKALSYVKENGSAVDFDKHLRHLGEQDHKQTEANYTLIRFVVALTPILGFFGTVIHFGTAIGSFTLDDNSKLSILTRELGTGFNTTAVALAAALTMTFAMFLCQRIERSLNTTIDLAVEAELVNRFEVKEASVLPFLAAAETANREALEMQTQTFEKQVQLWSTALDRLFAQFHQRHEQEVGRWQTALDELQKRHEQYDAEREKRLRQAYTLIDQRQDQHLTQIDAAVEKALAFRSEVAELLQALTVVAKGEGRLVELQATLTNNLRVLHETRQIDSAMHGLTAAIHLLTARDRGSLHDSAKAA